jgi:hypothetical protein
MEKFFIGITVRSFPRHYNKEADAIAKATALLEPLPPDVFYETTTVRSATEEATPPKFVNAIQSEDWRAPIVAAVRGYYEVEDGVIDKRVENKKIRPKFIRSGDLVLCKIPKGKLKGKMHRKWEGPFIATATSNEAAFKLRWLSGEEEPYTWNVDMLQKYFV